MAVGSKSNFIIYEDEFFAGAYEVVEQNVNVFNELSNGAIRLIPETHRGDFYKRSFFQNPTLISRRDPTAVTAVASTAMTMDDATSPKLARRIGPIEQTEDSFRKIDEDPAIMSFILGQQTGPAIFKDHLDTGVMACEACLDGVAALEIDNTGSTITTAMLVDVLAKFGDAAGRIIAWVMHSKPFYDLVKAQIAAKITNIADVNVMTGMPVTLGRPVIVTDSSSLVLDGTTDYYVTLGLTADGVVVMESEQRKIVNEQVTGYENLTQRLQGEYSITTRVKGFDYTGAANPNAATLGASANWSQVAADVKSCAGVRLATS